MPSFTRTTALAALVALVFTTVSGHGFPTQPRARGAMKCNRRIPNPVLDSSAPIDTCPQCNSCGGIGATSKGGPFKIFAPFEYKREAITLCGDPVGSNAHTKTGRFANTAKMPFAATYAAGSVANFEYDITANHKGYLAFFLCDVSGGGDVKNDPAFFKSNCHELVRSPHAACEAGTDKDCGPIDPKFPTRFNVPCQDGQGDRIFGGDSGKMAYKIPNVAMAEAVVVTYWLAANSCRPTDGFFQNYKYPAAWGGCGTPGTGLSSCGGGIMPEEFFSCSDVSITGGAGGGKPNAATEAPATTAYQAATTAYVAPATTAYVAVTTAAPVTTAYEAPATTVYVAPATTAAYEAPATLPADTQAPATTAYEAPATTAAYEAPASLPADTQAPATTAAVAPTVACVVEDERCGGYSGDCCAGSTCEEVGSGYRKSKKCVLTAVSPTEAPTDAPTTVYVAPTGASIEAPTTVYVAQTEAPTVAPGGDTGGADVKCYKAGERNQGAPGKPLVHYAPCCDGQASATKAGDWGKFCPSTAAPGGDTGGADVKCYKAGERNQGAPGKPRVHYAPCCDGKASAPEDGDWGKFCPGAVSPTDAPTDGATTVYVSPTEAPATEATTIPYGVETTAAPATDAATTAGYKATTVAGYKATTAYDAATTAAQSGTTAYDAATTAAPAGTSAYGAATAESQTAEEKKEKDEVVEKVVDVLKEEEKKDGGESPVTGEPDSRTISQCLSTCFGI